MDKPSLPLPRLLRAPVVLLGVVIGSYLTGVFMACVTLGAWVEAALGGLGLRRVGGLSAVVGVVGFLLLGVFGVAWLANLWLGWPGLVAGPLLALGLIALLARW